MSITNTELAAQLQDVATSWQSFNLQQLNWLTTTADTVTLTDHVTLQEITVKSLYKIEADYDAIFDDASGDLAQISQMLTDTQALQASMTTMHDAVVAYDVTFTGYLAQTAQDVTDCDDSAAAAAASALAAANSAVAAGDHADDAEAARDLAQGYRDEAETFKTQAQTAKTDAESEAAAALTSRNEAMTFRNEAETAKTGAETSETNAQTAEAKAQDWAEKPEDTEVEPGKYSALHHATKAEDSASSAAASLGAIGNAETNAANSAAAALVSESNAAASETNAADSETSAEKWASEDINVPVKPGLFSALHYADRAEFYGTEAAKYAVWPEDVDFGGQYSALHWAAKAEDFATNAGTSETNAFTSENNAATSETNAATSETNAAASETNAATSEANALSSEHLAEDWASKDYGSIITSSKGGSDYSAKHYSTLASEWATKAEDSAVTPGLYSALHWAEKAADHASNASQYEGDCQSYALVASTSASNATTSASNAATSETNAATSASNAASSASAAAASAASINDKVAAVFTNAVGVTGISSTDTILNISSSGASDGVDAPSLSSDEITFNKDGNYMIQAVIGLDTNTSGTHVMETKPQYYDGSWGNIHGGRIKVRTRVGDGDDNTAILSFVMLGVSDGDKLRFETKRLLGSTTAAFQSNNATTISVAEI